MATDLTKIATCCYCGSRTVLRFDAGMHELTCRSCGAALHNMKPMKTTAMKPTPKPRKMHRDDIADFWTEGRKPKKTKPKKQRSGKRKRRFDFKDLLEDGVGDLLEDVFDIFD